MKKGRHCGWTVTQLSNEARGETPTVNSVYMITHLLQKLLTTAEETLNFFYVRIIITVHNRVEIFLMILIVKTFHNLANAVNDPVAESSLIEFFTCSS